MPVMYQVWLLVQQRLAPPKKLIFLEGQFSIQAAFDMPGRITIPI
jgi:hypothetical protein